MLLLSTLVAVPMLSLTGFVFGAVIVQALDWLLTPARWNGSQLPADPLDDPSYDWACDGWWFDDPDPDDERCELPCRAGPGNRPQVLLTHERVEQNYLTVWHVIDGAQH